MSQLALTQVVYTACLTYKDDSSPEARRVLIQCAVLNMEIPAARDLTVAEAWQADNRKIQHERTSGLEQSGATWLDYYR
jgi:hypothetical protein